MPIGTGGRPPGQSKTGGRQRGTRNKRTASGIEKLQAIGCDPMTLAAEIALDKAHDVGVRLQAIGMLLPYAYPKLRPIEHGEPKGTVIKPITVLEGMPETPSNTQAAIQVQSERGTTL